MKHYRVFSIRYDIDDGPASTPEELIIGVPAEEMERLEDFLSDEISQQTGWCHNGFQYEEVTV